MSIFHRLSTNPYYSWLLSLPEEFAAVVVFSKMLHGRASTVVEYKIRELDINSVLQYE
jgi:hypothetical protein